MQSDDQPAVDTVRRFPVNFVADVHLVQILGEQLIGSEKVGILELIKNAYDAGASECHVWIEKIPGLPEVEVSDPQVAKLDGPVITICDNGCGMDRSTLDNGWLRAATRIKTSVKEQLKQERALADQRGSRSEYDALVQTLKRAYGGRLPLGEKGVGRFAAHRLGRYLALQTKTRDESCEWFLEIDWSTFDVLGDEPVDLDKIKLTLISRPPMWDYGPTDSGTVLRIYGGCEGFAWTEDKLLEIGRAIAHLGSPAKQPTGFKVEFHCPQLSEKIEVPTETVPAPFECTAIIDEKGKADIEVRFRPPGKLKYPIAPRDWSFDGVDLRVDASDWLLPEYDPKLRSSDRAAHLRKPACGPFTVDVKLWLRTKEWIEYADWSEFTGYLDAYGGLGIFRDGLSILPAQLTSRDDWLGLSRRQIKKGWNISYYMMSGSIDLLQEQTLDLVDRTSREGLLETGPYEDLKKLVFQVLLQLETCVRGTRTDYSKLVQGDRLPARVLSSRTRQATRVLETVASKYDFGSDSLGIGDAIGKTSEPRETISDLAKTFDQARREIRELRRESNALLEAAGYGIAIAVAVHEIEKVTSNLYYGLDRLSQDAILSTSPEVRSRSVELARQAKSLLNELKRLAPLRVTRLERASTFGIRSAVLSASGAFRLAWDELDILFSAPPKEPDFEVHGSFGACSQVFANLFDNATYWLQQIEPAGRRIIARLDIDERKVIVADNGPGIADSIRPHLFKPFFSLKDPPSGLGLYICRYYMQQMNGTIRESYQPERIPGFMGAQFTIIFREET